MRKIFTLVFLATLIQLNPSNAQVDSLIATEFYPANGDLGITGNISGLIMNVNATPRNDFRGYSSLLVRYKIDDRFTFRVGLAPSIANYKVQSTDSVGKDLIEYDSTASQNSISIRPGIEYHITGTKRLDPYFAIDAEAGTISKFNSKANKSITDTTGTSKMLRTINEAGGYSLGLKLSAGMNYFLAQKLALGLEYGLGLSYLTTGGDRQEVIQAQPVSGSSSTTRILGSRRTNDLDLFIDPSIQFTLSYFFSI